VHSFTATVPVPAFPMPIAQIEALFNPEPTARPGTVRDWSFLTGPESGETQANYHWKNSRSSQLLL
jgi:hypothetical protein